MSKVSGNSQMNHYANPNNSSHTAMNNKQMKPNNSAYYSSRGSKSK